MSHVDSQHQHAWATQDDWEAHRETISRLYWDECRPLPDVMEIMRSEHSFHATPRMYKFRFKKWGLTKNLKNDQDEEIRVQAASGGIPAVPLIRGRVPGSKKLKRYVNRLAPDCIPESAIEPSRIRSPVCKVVGHDARTPTPTSTQGTTTPTTTTTTSSVAVVTSTRGFHPPQQQSPVSAIFMDQPDSLRFTQQSLRAVLDYTSNRVRKGVWDPTGAPYDDEDHAENWHNKVFQASGMIQRGKFREGFRLLDICYRNYTAQLDAEHPLLIIETYTSVLHLARIEHALAYSLVRYIAGLCRIRLGPAHPFTRFWAGLQAMGVPQVRGAVGAVVRAQFDLFEAYFAPGAEFLIIQNVDSARTLHEAGCIPLASAEAIIARAIQQRRLGASAGRPGADDFVCWARLVLALLYVRDGRCDLAQPVIDAVGARIRADGPGGGGGGDEISIFTQNEYRTIRGYQLRGAGAAHGELAACLRERFDFCLRTVGPGHHYATRAFAELDELYRQAGEVEAAERLRADFDFATQWEQVCKKEEERAAGRGLRVYDVGDGDGDEVCTDET